ncbi:MAG TPA: hypothetical protein VMT52_14785, partial [Planctomycetota bacterium]|nr:hypothetical protein [Planctomycetota bacterium]
MRLFFRTFAYSGLVVFALCYLTFQLHSASSQVKARLELLLGRFVASSVKAEGCEQPPLGSLKVKRVTVAAAPVIDARTILSIDDLTVTGTPARRAFRFLRIAESGATPPTIHARSADLSLDHEMPSPGTGPGRWNFDALLRLDSISEALNALHAHVLIDRLLIHLEDARPVRSKLSLEWGLKDVEVRHDVTQGLTVEADIEEGESWSDGRLEASWTPAEGLRARGELEEVRATETWTALLGEERVRLWEALRPSGSCDLDLEHLHVARDGSTTFRAFLRHYDTSVHLGALGLQLQHISGPMEVTEERIALGGDGVGEAVTAELLGVPVEVEAVFDATRADLRLQLPPAPVEGLLLPREADGTAFSSLVALLKPRGRVSGSWNVFLRPAAAERLWGSLEVRGASFSGFPFITHIDALVHFERAAGAVGTEGGKGKVLLEDVRCAGLQRLSGEVRFTWDTKGVRFECTDLRLGEEAATLPGEGPRNGPDVAEKRPKEPGTLIASAVWDWERGFVSHDLRWLGLGLTTGLLQAREASGGLSSGKGGSLKLEGVTIPAGVLWPEAGDLVFRAGECRLGAGERGGVRVQSFRLSGEAGSLRATGTVAATGRLDLVVLHAEGPNHAALNALPPSSRPGQWREAVKGKCRPFRVTGTLA